ncbi:MAG: GTP pyrophosphokinase family protein [Clostridiales bacterium]|nr:GTP pyrophosphokinase family protein [Clostridiales bacterium]
MKQSQAQIQEQAQAQGFYAEANEGDGADERFYGEYYAALKAAESAFAEALAAMEGARADKKRRFPVEHYKTRIKSAASAKEKLARLGFPQTAEAAVQRLYDLVGARIVCQFIGDIYALEQALRDTGSFELVRTKDYIKAPKPNGYRSLHIILRQSGASCPSESRLFAPPEIFVEVQIRTIAMDFWASLEHELKYKKNIPDADLMFGELKRCADEIASTDLTMQTIFEWIQNAAEAGI